MKKLEYLKSKTIIYEPTDDDLLAMILRGIGHRNMD